MKAAWESHEPEGQVSHPYAGGPLPLHTAAKAPGQCHAVLREPSAALSEPEAKHSQVCLIGQAWVTCPGSRCQGFGAGRLCTLLHGHGLCAYQYHTCGTLQWEGELGAGQPPPANDGSSPQPP